MKVKVLGCGASVGVPSIRCKCNICLSQDSKNKRLRSSVLLQVGEYTILIDTSPDLRYQALRASFNKVYGVVYTHIHFDHSLGINDLVSFNKTYDNSTIPIYADSYTIENLYIAYPYLFKTVVFEQQNRNYLLANTVGWYKEFIIGSSNIKCILTEQNHGSIQSSGVVIGRFAYCTDFIDMTPRSLQILKDAKLEVLIIQCLKYSSSLAHTNLKGCLQWIEKINPKRAFLTHMNHELDYKTLSQELQEHSKRLKIDIVPAYDGLEIDV